MERHGLYTSLEDLYKAVKVESPFYSDFDMGSLRKLGLKKDLNGYYHKSDFVIKFYSTDWKNKHNIKSFPVSEVSNQGETLHQELPILTLDPIKMLERTAYIEAYEFSLLLFNKKTSTYISNTRKILGIPENGFKNFKERASWLKKNTKVLFKLGYLEKPNDISMVQSLYMSYIEKFLSENTNFRKKNFARQSLFLTIFFDYITLNDCFSSVRITHIKDRKLVPNSGFKFPLPPKKFVDDNIEIHLVVYKDTTKDEVKGIIDRSWKTIESYKSKLPVVNEKRRIKDVDILEKKLKIFDLYQKGHTNNRISALLKMDSGYVRKIVSEVKKEIREIEKL